MSASNWAVCPRCLRLAREAEATRLTAVMATYGKVPVDEFFKARAAVEPVSPGDFATFREDYEIYGAADGAVTVEYSGGCGKCGLSLSFTDHHPLEARDEQG